VAHLDAEHEASAPQPRHLHAIMHMCMSAA
jgi:hypothetical protein